MNRKLNNIQEKQFNLALCHSVSVLKNVLFEFEILAGPSFEESEENCQYQNVINLIDELKKALSENPENMIDSVMRKHRQSLWKLPSIWIDSIRIQS